MESLTGYRFAVGLDFLRRFCAAKEFAGEMTILDGTF